MLDTRSSILSNTNYTFNDEFSSNWNIFLEKEAAPQPLHRLMHAAFINFIPQVLQVFMGHKESIHESTI